MSFFIYQILPQKNREYKLFAQDTQLAHHAAKVIFRKVFENLIEYFFPDIHIR